MEVIVEVGAGLDVHKKTVVACCIDGRSNPPTVSRRTFRTFRADLEKLREWLVGKGCTHVAMESTGVYWYPVHRVLEGHLEIVVGNARHMSNVPGRKTDRVDAEWTAQLLRHGLIKKNFIPPPPLRELRQLTRTRRKLILTRTSVQLRVSKLLECANIKLGSVASEVFGVSGRTMLGALAVGITDPSVLAEMAVGRLRRKREDLRLAFDGFFGEQDRALLTVQLELVDSIEHQLAQLQRLIDQRVTPYQELIALLDTIPGVDRVLAIDLIAEIGPDMNAWPSVDHFIAWTGTCPGNKQSAGKRFRAKARDGNPYVKLVLTQAAVSAGRTSTYLGKRYHHIASRRGERRAVVAIGREIAHAAFNMISTGQLYRPPSPKPRSPETQRNRILRQLHKLGYEATLTPLPT
jgi:transposase